MAAATSEAFGTYAQMATILVAQRSQAWQNTLPWKHICKEQHILYHAAISIRWNELSQDWRIRFLYFLPNSCKSNKVEQSMWLPDCSQHINVVSSTIIYVFAAKHRKRAAYSNQWLHSGLRSPIAERPSSQSRYNGHNILHSKCTELQYCKTQF